MKRQSRERLIVEEKLRNELVKYFTRLEKQVLATYEKASEQGIPLHNIMVLIQILFNDWHKEYTGTINHYTALNEQLARQQLNELIEIQRKRRIGRNRKKKPLSIKPFITLDDNPIHELAVKATLDDGIPEEDKKIYNYSIEPNPVTTKQLETATFQFSDKTRQRVNGEINDILKLSETEGLGPRQVGQKIRERFGKLKGYEAERIARTECLRASNTYRYDTLVNDDLIDYYQWYSNIDSRTRGRRKGDKANHIVLDGEIVRKGEVFSNGLRYPGDPNAPGYETINCRCTLVPYIVPWDKVAPAGKVRFHESELLPRPEDETTDLMLESLEAVNFIKPVEGGFRASPSNLTVQGQQLKQALAQLVGITLEGKVKGISTLQDKLDKWLNKPTTEEISAVTPSKVEIKPLTPEEKAELEDLMKQLEENEGFIGYNPIEGGTPSIEWKYDQPLSGFTKQMEDRLKKLTKQKYDVLIAKPKISKTPTKSHTEIIHELEDELKPVLDKEKHMNDKLSQLHDFSADAPFIDLPIEKDINKLKNKIESLKQPSKLFDATKLSPSKQEEWKQITQELLDEVTSEYPSDQTISRLKAGVRTFMKRNPTNQGFNINNLTKAEQKQYTKLIEMEKNDTLSFLKKIDLKKLRVKGSLSSQTQKEIDKLQEEVDHLEDIKFKQLDAIEEGLKKTRKKLEKELDDILKERGDIERKIGKQHIQNKSKPSNQVVPTSSESLSGVKFNKYDGIEENREDYHNFCQILNSQETNKPFGIYQYSKGSGHFNQHLKLKREGRTDEIEDNILNALVHPDSIYKIKDKNIIEELDHFEVKQNRSPLTDAVNKLKTKLHNGDSTIKKYYDDVLESFEREEKDFYDSAVTFNENIITYSGQSYNRYGHLKKGDKWEAPKMVSSSLTEERTDYFVKRRVKKDEDTAVKIRFFHQKDTKQVVIGERSLHPHEAEIVQLPGQTGTVVKRGREKFEFYGDNGWDETYIPTLDILLDPM